MHYFPETQPVGGNVMSSTGGASVFGGTSVYSGKTNRDQKVSQPRGISRTIEHVVTFGESGSEVFCAKFDPTDKYLACGFADGITRIYNNATQKLSFTL
jgi:WD40 repeat protein